MNSYGIDFETKQIRRAGFYFAIGAIQAFALLFFVGLAISLFFHEKDDCDKSFWDRCGMTVTTDNLTGKQYLLSPHGGMIERNATNDTR